MQGPDLASRATGHDLNSIGAQGSYTIGFGRLERDEPVDLGVEVVRDWAICKRALLRTPLRCPSYVTGCCLARPDSLSFLLWLRTVTFCNADQSTVATATKSGLVSGKVCSVELWRPSSAAAGT